MVEVQFAKERRSPELYEKLMLEPGTGRRSRGLKQQSLTLSSWRKWLKWSSGVRTELEGSRNTEGCRQTVLDNVPSEG